MKTRISIPAISVFALILMAASFNAVLPKTSLGQTVPEFNLRPLLGKNFDSYERVIGKAKLRMEGKGDNLSESRFYKVPGFVRVVLTVGNNGNGSVKPTKKLGYVSEVNVHFPVGSISDWKTAIKKVGLSPTNVKATPDEGYVALENTVEKWEGAWIPNSPDDKGLDVLQVFPADSKGMARSVFGKKLWSVVVGKKEDVQKVFGEPDGKNKWGKGYKIPGFENRLMSFYSSDEGKTKVICMLDMADLGKTTASTVFQKFGWDISKWKSVEKRIDDGDYSETLEYQGVAFQIKVMSRTHSMDDSLFSITRK